MLAGVREILIITNPNNISLFKKLLGNGSQWGINLQYAVQLEPNGIAEGLLIAEDFLDGASSIMALGDNLFFGNGLKDKLKEASQTDLGSTMFVLKSTNPANFGVVEIGKDHKIISIEEKPENPKSNFIATGLYFFDSKASQFTKEISPSNRGELEITDVLKAYGDLGELNFIKLDRGFAWFDTGTVDNLLMASNFVQTIQQNSGQMIGCLEEIAYDMGWIDYKKMKKATSKFYKSPMAGYLADLLEMKN